jgi:hypothetical protein
VRGKPGFGYTGGSGHMKLTAAIMGILAFLLVGCGGKNGGGPDGSDGDGGAGCPDMSGTWAYGNNCRNDAGGSAMGINADLTQADCEITSVWKDDKTQDEDILSGTIDEDGNTTVTIAFDEGTVTCTGSLSSNTWDSTCTPGGCTLEAEKL